MIDTVDKIPVMTVFMTSALPMANHHPMNKFFEIITIIPKNWKNIVARKSDTFSSANL